MGKTLRAHSNKFQLEKASHSRCTAGHPYCFDPSLANVFFCSVSALHIIAGIR